jgi:hypothetical protein
MSDGIQVRAGMDLADADITCAFWKGALQGGNDAPVKGAPAPAIQSQSFPAPRIRRNKSEHGENSLNDSDAALAGAVVTAEGELVVPASQRPDGRYLANFCSLGPP